MQPWVTSPSFVVDKPKTDVFAPVGGWQEQIITKAPWVKETPKPAPEYQTDENLKKAFGIELAKTTNPLDAAVKVAGDDQSKALWISFHWLTDPVVVASRDIYLKTLELSTPPLDKEQLAAKVLALADEKILSPKLGVLIPVSEAKDRIAAYKLYSEIMGYTGKVEIDQSTKTFTHNEMTIKLVKAEDRKPAHTIEHAPNVKSENVEHSSPITLKLVGGASR
jgi:hypothetical protein